MLPTIQVFVEDAMYVFQGGIPMSTEGILHIGEAREVRSYLSVWSTSRHISVPISNILCKAMNPEGQR